MSGSIKFLSSNSTPGSRVGVGISSIVGPTGPAGAFGGPQGNQGISGLQGSQGLIGFQGLVGTGAIGSQGFQGNQGFRGFQGNQGLKGDVGQGFVVFANANSYTGLNNVIATGGNLGQFVLVLGGDLFVYSGTGAGTTGPGNSYGYAGDVTDESKLIGFQGNQGLRGTTGAQGFQGIAGTTGTNGVQGSQGPAGAGGSGTGTSQWNSSTGGIIYYNSGSVGIGKANPTTTLDVLGNMSIVGNTIMTGTLNISGNITCTNTGSLINPTLQNYRETVFLGTFGGAYIINCNTGNNFALTMSSGSNSLSFINPAATGTLTNINLFLTQSASGNCVVSWPASVSWGNPSTPILSTTGNATDLLTFTTFTGGSKWLGFLAGRGF